MSVEVADENGPFAQVASNNGYQELVDAAREDSVLATFFWHGITEKTDEVAKHLEQLQARPSVMETAKNLAKVIRGREFVLITRGESADMPDENGVAEPEARKMFEEALKHEMEGGASELRAHVTAFKVLRDAGFQHVNGMWIEKSEPAVSDTHMDRPLGAVRYQGDRGGRKQRKLKGDEKREKPPKEKDDPGTQDVATEEEELALPLPDLQPHQRASKICKRISGSSSIELSCQGAKLVTALGERLHERGGLDTIQSSVLRRGKQTAEMLVRQHPETEILTPAEQLVPWHLGEYEGRKPKEVKGFIANYIEHPDERPPGRGADGSEAETFKEAATRQLSYLQAQHDEWEEHPERKTGLVMHSRVLALLQAYVDAGEPGVDKFLKEVKSDELVNPNDPEHTTLLRWHDGEIEELDPKDEDELEGGHYLILHGLTEDDADEGNAAALAKRLYLPPLEVHRAAKAAQEQGATVDGITEPLATSVGLTEEEIRKVAEFFASNGDTPLPPHAVNAWGGPQARKWANKILLKIAPSPEGVECVGLEEEVGFEIEGTVVKTDEEQKLVFGWASVISIEGKIITDTQGDRITAETLEAAGYDYVLEARKGGHMHHEKQVAKMVESCVFTREKQQAMQKSLEDQGIHAAVDLGCVAWWIGFKVEDPEVWKDIKSGKLRAFSVGGKGKRQKVAS